MYDSPALLLVGPGLVRLEVLQDGLVVLGVGPLRRVPALHVLVVPVHALLHVPGHVQPVLDDDVGVLRRRHPLLGAVVVRVLQEPDKEHDPVQVGQLGVQGGLKHVGHGHVGVAALVVPPLIPAAGGLDLQDVGAPAVLLDVAVHHAAEDLLVVEVVVPALLLRHGLLHGQSDVVSDSQQLLQKGGDPGSEVLPEHGLQDVAGVDVLVGLVPRVEPGELAGHLERGGELAEPQDRRDPGAGDLLQPVRVEDNRLLVLIDVHDPCSTVEGHGFGNAHIDYVLSADAVC